MDAGEHTKIPPISPLPSVWQCCFVEQNNRYIILTYNYPKKNDSKVKALHEHWNIGYNPIRSKRLEEELWKEIETFPAQNIKDKISCSLHIYLGFSFIWCDDLNTVPFFMYFLASLCWNWFQHCNILLQQHGGFGMSRSSAQCMTAPCVWAAGGEDGGWRWTPAPDKEKQRGWQFSECIIQCYQGTRHTGTQYLCFHSNQIAGFEIQEAVRHNSTPV